MGIVFGVPVRFRDATDFNVGFYLIIIETLFKFNLNVFYKIISYILRHLN